jgi:hypothetical protein
MAIRPAKNPVPRLSAGQSFPRVELPPFEPLQREDVTLATPAVILQGERDAAYRVINALVRRYAGGSAFLDAGAADVEQPVVTVELMRDADGFTITTRPL